jgi:hypothetical protein
MPFTPRPPHCTSAHRAGTRPAVQPGHGGRGTSFKPLRAASVRVAAHTHETAAKLESHEQLLPASDGHAVGPQRRRRAVTRAGAQA